MRKLKDVGKSKIRIYRTKCLLQGGKELHGYLIFRLNKAKVASEPFRNQ